MRDLNEGFRIGELAPSVGDSGSRLKNQMSFSSRQSSLMSQISEMGEEELGGNSPDESSQCYVAGVPMTSWAETSLLAGNKLSGTGSREEEVRVVELRNHVAGLTHQLSLPKTTAEMAAMEKLIQFQDAVPCRIRAKRGCATHPRSIAERVSQSVFSSSLLHLKTLINLNYQVRRTKISERMRKLQELVPNMDKVSISIPSNGTVTAPRPSSNLP